MLNPKVENLPLKGCINLGFGYYPYKVLINIGDGYIVKIRYTKSEVDYDACGKDVSIMSAMVLAGREVKRALSI